MSGQGVEEVLAILRETPGRIAAITAGVPADRLRRAPAEGEWSMVEILAHLRACDDVWGDCIRTILSEDRPAIEAVNPRRWIRSTDYPQLEFGRSLRAFTKQRGQLVTLLEPLPAQAWERVGDVYVWGVTYQRSALFYARWLAKHERSHWKALARTVEAVQARGSGARMTGS